MFRLCQTEKALILRYLRIVHASEHAVLIVFVQDISIEEAADTRRGARCGVTSIVCADERQ